MADTKLSALTELAATPAVDDEVYIRDVSEAAADESKRITIANLLGSHAIGARVYDAGDQTIANATLVAVNFDSERYDTDTIHDNSTNNTRLTCKTAGKYIIVANVQFAVNDTGIRLVRINLNGGTTIGEQRNAPCDSTDVIEVASIYDLSVNDYVEAVVYQDSGGNLDIIAAGNSTNEFMMQRIG